MLRTMRAWPVAERALTKVLLTSLLVVALGATHPVTGQGDAMPPEQAGPAGEAGGGNDTPRLIGPPVRDGGPGDGNDTPRLIGPPVRDEVRFNFHVKCYQNKLAVTGATIRLTKVDRSVYGVLATDALGNATTTVPLGLPLRAEVSARGYADYPTILMPAKVATVREVNILMNKPGAVRLPDTTRDVHIGVKCTHQITKDQIAFVDDERTIDFVMGLGEFCEHEEDARVFAKCSAKPLFRNSSAMDALGSPPGPCWNGDWVKYWATIENNPSWVLRDCDGRPITSAYWPNAMMDPNSKGWRQFWHDRVIEILKDGVYDSIRMDVVYDHLETWTRNGILPCDYDKERFHRGVVELVKAVKSAMPDAPLQIHPMWPSYDGTMQHFKELMQYADGSDIEQFCFLWNGKPQSLDVWKKQVSTIMWNEHHRKNTHAFSSGGELFANVDLRIFALASYLLGKGSRSWFYHEKGDGWGVYFFPEFRIPIGAPSETLYSDPDVAPQGPAERAVAPVDAYYDRTLGLYRRTFENGIVLVNPTSARSATYTPAKPAFRVAPTGGMIPELGGDGRLEYAPVSAITLEPGQAAILLLQPDLGQGVNGSPAAPRVDTPQQ